MSLTVRWWDVILECRVDNSNIFKCNCETVCRSNQTCYALSPEDQDCVVCRLHGVHMHIKKGSRKLINDKRDPWKKL